MSAQSGEVCENCGRGLYTVYSSRLSKDEKFQIQHLQCACCKFKPTENKVIQEAGSIRRRHTLLRTRMTLNRRRTA